MGRYEAFGRCLDRCESFIERRFLVALLFSEQFSFEPIAPSAGGIAEDRDGVILGQQVPVARYRVDFAMKRRGSLHRVAIELDGHKFHDKTPAQAEHDRVRDRVLLSLGWQTVRFAGRELVRDAVGCAREARELVLSLSGASVQLAKAAAPTQLLLPRSAIG